MKKQLLSALAIAFATAGFAQSKFDGTGYADNFNDGILAASPEDGWFNDPAVYPSVTEEGGKLVVTANNADQLFKGFGLYLKTTEAIDLSNNSVVSFKVTNNGSAAIKLRVDLKFVDPNFESPATCAPNDTVNANNGITHEVTVAAGATADVSFDFAGANYEYDSDCSDDAYTPETYAIQDYSRTAGLYMVINGGAGESWCTTAPYCTPFTGSISFDDLVIGDAPTSTKSASSLVASTKLYPNPATESASVELSLKESSDVKVTLSDLMGREVAVIANERNVAVNKSFSTANLVKGMYTVNYFINGAPAKAELLMVK